MSNKLEEQTENFEISDLRRKAEQGDAERQFNLGVLYKKGQGVPQNDATAREWFEKAAAQGHEAMSCQSIGV